MLPGRDVRCGQAGMRVSAGVHMVTQGHVGHAGHPHVDGLRADARRIRQRDALLLELHPQARQLHSTHIMSLAVSAIPQAVSLEKPLAFESQTSSFKRLRQHMALSVPVTIVRGDLRGATKHTWSLGSMKQSAARHRRLHLKRACRLVRLRVVKPVHAVGLRRMLL